ncbi:hypothetical protein TNCV_1365491 [Trichonephila clavipes]|nr:hypothetical protein TNCV_1365491 [Trichonephila clavipes]
MKELLNSLYDFTDHIHQAVSEFSSVVPCTINGCPHHDYPSNNPSIMILDNVNNENNCNNDINMETEKSLPTKRKEKSDGFTTPSHTKETAENLTTELASTTNQNIVIAPPPTENLLNAPTANSNAPKPNFVPPPIMLKVTEIYKQQMKVITDKLPTTREKNSPDVILVQETHLRPKHNINIDNYEWYRNDRITEGQAYGSTLILIKKSIPHFHIFILLLPSFIMLKQPWSRSTLLI